MELKEPDRVMRAETEYIYFEIFRCAFHERLFLFGDTSIATGNYQAGVSWHLPIDRPDEWIIRAPPPWQARRHSVRCSTRCYRLGLLLDRKPLVEETRGGNDILGPFKRLSHSLFHSLSFALFLSLPSSLTGSNDKP